MGTTEKSVLSKFLTGGDLLFHRLQLFMANFFRLILFGIAVFSVSSWILIQTFVSKYEWHVFYKTMYASFWKLVRLPNYRIDFVRPDGQMVDKVTSTAIVKFIDETPELFAIFERVVWFFSLSFLISITSVVFLILYYVRSGRAAQTDDFLRGQKIVTAEQLRSMMKEQSPIKIAGVSIPKELLARNILGVGSMGTGKSQFVNQIIEDARKWGKKMVIYDKTGEFTQKFFRPGIDVLLSPVDARCADWSIFADLRKITDPAMVSRFFVPENKQSSDPIWDNAARMLLEDIINIVYQANGTMADVKNIITQSSLEELFALLKKHNSPSCGTITPANPRGAESIRLTLVAQPAIRFFSFFDKKAASFSVREFVRQDDDACLFLVSNSTQHETSKPFISAWIELALAEVMSMPPATDTRLIFILDELASLSKLKALDVAFTEARKFGIVSVVCIQNLSQLDDLYGYDVTKTFVANLQNKAVFRTEEFESATRLADTLGKEEVEEKSESKSFGVESSKDGVTLAGKRTERHLVTPTQIMVLPDLTGYLKIAGNFPIAKVSLQYKARENNVEAYIERDGLDLVKDAPKLIQEPVADEAVREVPKGKLPAQKVKLPAPVPASPVVVQKPKPQSVAPDEGGVF